LASKGPPEEWNVQAAFIDLTLAELLSKAHSVVWVDVLDVEERWRWHGVEWSRYRAAVRRCIFSRTGLAAAETVSIVQLGGGERIYYNFHHLQPGRSYILVLESAEVGGRSCPNVLGHPVGLYPLVCEDVVERWWPPPWATEKNPFVDVDELVGQILALTGDQRMGRALTPEDVLKGVPRQPRR
jgi:hypothetical protein